MRTARLVLPMVCISSLACPLPAADQPQVGEYGTRNPVSQEKHLPADFDPGRKDKSGQIDLATTRNVKWVARLGNQSYGTPVVAGGKIFVGTNNDEPRDPRIEGDRGVLMCFDERSGEFLWQLNLPKLQWIKWADWKYIGITSSPAVEGKRAYLVSNRGEVMCLDTEGMANGNDGPFTDEGRLMAEEGQPPLTPGAHDADVLWLLDMPRQLGAEPHNGTNGLPLIHGDLLYVSTSLGVEWTHDHVVNPQAPSVIVLDKHTGKLLARDDFGIGPDIIHGQWSSPSMGQVDGRPLFFFGSGSGWLYAFEGLAGPRPSAEPALLKNVWRFNGHPLAQTQDQVEIDHQHDSSSYEVTGNPVFCDGRVYVTFTQEPFHRMKLGRLACLDAAGSGNRTRGGMRWSYDAIGSSCSTVAVADGLVYAAGFDGRLHCLDAQTGQCYWVHEAGGPIWASPVVADGKLYLGTGKSMFWVLRPGKELKVLNQIRMPEIVHTNAVAANGVLYVATYKHLYAIQEKRQ